MSAQSGRSDTVRALLPLRRTSIEIDDLLAAIDISIAKNPEPGVRLTVEDPTGPNPNIVITEAERVTAVTVDRLVRDMETARVPNRRHDLVRAFRQWLGQRPVPDDVAAMRGIAVPTWADDREHHVRWTVVVVRGTDNLVEWVPSFRTRPEQVRFVRDIALERAKVLPTEPLRAGDVTVWVHANRPGLSTAVLADPGRMLTHEGGLIDPYVVFSPGRPVVCAERAAAVRLTEETTEPHVMLKVNEIDKIGWN